MLPPPGNNKKRKTQVDHGGEPTKLAPVLPNSRSASTNITGLSLSGLSRQSSFSSSRPASSSSLRNASSGLSSINVGQGIRPPSAQMLRPHTAQSAHSTQKNRANTGRSTSSFDAQNLSMSGIQASENRLSTTSFPTISKRYPRQLSYNESPRGSYDNQMNYTSDWSSSASLTPKSLRDLSTSTTSSMSTLSLNLEKDSPLSPKKTLPQCSPSHIPKPALPKTPLSSKTPSPSKSRRKTEQWTYLTKESNTRTAVFDSEARLGNVENLYHVLKEKMETTITESSGLKESIAMYKAKSR